MTTTEEKQTRLVYLLGVIGDEIHDARSAAARGDMVECRRALGDVPEYIAGCVNISKIIEREIRAEVQP